MNNIFLRLGKMDHLAPDDIFQEFGHPVRKKVVRLDGKALGPGISMYSIASMRIGLSASTVNHSDLVISDFGAACILPSRPSGGITAAPTRAPEYHLGLTQEYGLPGDAWSAACVIYNVLANWTLFYLHPTIPVEDESDEILRQILQLLGPPPGEMLAAWGDQGGEHCATERHRAEIDSGRVDSLFAKTHSKRRRQGDSEQDFSRDELDDLYDLLKRMLRWRPAERISAEEACQSDWMRRWGLPAIKRTGG